MISGEKVRFDQNVPEKNIVTLPNRNERFKLQWQQVKDQLDGRAVIRD